MKKVIDLISKVKSPEALSFQYRYNGILHTYESTIEDLEAMMGDNPLLSIFKNHVKANGNNPFVIEKVIVKILDINKDVEGNYTRVPRKIYSVTYEQYDSDVIILSKEMLIDTCNKVREENSQKRQRANQLQILEDDVHFPRRFYDDMKNNPSPKEESKPEEIVEEAPKEDPIDREKIESFISDGDNTIVDDFNREENNINNVDSIIGEPNSQPDDEISKELSASLEEVFKEKGWD